jgi:predicted SnoaL-like aldol condensation-catalyzing enzyme
VSDSVAAAGADHRAVVTEFADLFYRVKDVPAAFTRFVAEDYVQHNPTIVDGRQAAIDALTDKFAAPEMTFDIQRILVDGDLAVIHVRACRSGVPMGAVADFYRLRDGVVVEHWDVLQPVDPDAVNPHPYF